MVAGEKGYFWYGVAVDRTGHIKLRQYITVRNGFADSYDVESWSRGISGKLWHVVRIQEGMTFEFARATVKKLREKWGTEYITIDEGEYQQAERKGNPVESGVDTDFWYKILGVEQTADFETVKAAYKKLAFTYHPDSKADFATPNADMFIAIQAAWEYYGKNVKGA